MDINLESAWQAALARVVETLGPRQFALGHSFQQR